MGSRIGLAWAGMCCGSLLGMAAVALSGLGLGLVHPRDSLEWWVPAVGGGGGALAGIVIMFWWTSERTPR